MVGLDATLERFVIFLCILFTFSVLMNQTLSVFAAVAQTKATVQVMCACLLLFLILFGTWALATQMSRHGKVPTHNAHAFNFVLQVVSLCHPM